MGKGRLADDSFDAPERERGKFKARYELQRKLGRRGQHCQNIHLKQTDDQHVHSVRNAKIICLLQMNVVRVLHELMR